MAEVHFTFFSNSIKTTSDKSNGVFVGELVPNSIAYEHGIKVRMFVLFCFLFWSIYINEHWVQSTASINFKKS